MVMKKTIAIIGATEPTGKAATMQLASHPGVRFLLLSPDTTALASLTQTLHENFPGAEIEPMTCTREASWEADIILLTVPEAEEEMVAQLIKEVVTGKIVIHINETGTPSEILQQALPHSIIETLKPGELAGLSFTQSGVRS